MLSKVVNTALLCSLISELPEGWLPSLPTAALQNEITMVAAKPLLVLYRIAQFVSATGGWARGAPQRSTTLCSGQ